MIGHWFIITTVTSICLLHLCGTSELDDLSTNYHGATPNNWTYLSSELLAITDTDAQAMSSSANLSVALRLVGELMDGAVYTWRSTNQTNLINNSFKVVNNLIDDVYSTIWNELQSKSFEDCKSFLLNVDNFGHNISEILKTSNSNQPKDMDLSNIEVVFTRQPLADYNRILEFTNFESTLTLDGIYSQTDYIGITAIGYKSFSSLLTTSSRWLKNTNYSNHYLSSKLVSYSVSSTSNTTIAEPVLIQIRVTDNHKDWICGFVSNEQNGSLWSIDDGCSSYEEDSMIQCSCTHLTTFAILGCVEPSLPWQVKTSLVISNLIIAAVFVVLLYVNRHYYSDMVVLVMCVLATLFLEQLCILTGIYVVCNRPACKAMALIIHFFDLSIFFWVFGQSVQIALKISYVTMESGGIMQYCALGWITPAFIVASSVGLVQSDYENDQYCAVPKVSHASLGPIVCVVGCNYICLAYLIYGYNNIRRTDNKAYTVIRATKSTITANGIIITLMFISWSLWTSAVDVQDDSHYWLWAISVFVLGFAVLLFYGVNNSEVQSELLGRFGRKSAVQDGSVAGRAARSQHQLNEAIRLSQIIENSVVREQDSVVGGVDCDQITNDSTLSLTQTMTSSLAQRVGFRKARLGPSTANAKSEGTTSNI